MFVFLDQGMNGSSKKQRMERRITTTSERWSPAGASRKHCWRKRRPSGLWWPRGRGENRPVKWRSLAPPGALCGRAMGNTSTLTPRRGYRSGSCPRNWDTDTTLRNSSKPAQVIFRKIKKKKKIKFWKISNFKIKKNEMLHQHQQFLPSKPHPRWLTRPFWPRPKNPTSPRPRQRRPKLLSLTMSRRSGKYANKRFLRELQFLEVWVCFKLLSCRGLWVFFSTPYCTKSGQKLRPLSEKKNQILVPFQTFIEQKVVLSTFGTVNLLGVYWRLLKAF